MLIEEKLYDAITQLVNWRYPTGWGGAAGLVLENGDIITSVAPDTEFDAVALCMEVGSILEAHKRQLKVTHSLCLYRDTENAPLKILSPCGICQERLRHWGPDVRVGITNSQNKLIFKPISDLQPHYWRSAYD